MVDVEMMHTDAIEDCARVLAALPRGGSAKAEQGALLLFHARALLDCLDAAQRLDEQSDPGGSLQASSLLAR